MTFCGMWDGGRLNPNNLHNDKIILLGIRLNFIMAKKMSETIMKMIRKYNDGFFLMLPDPAVYGKHVRGAKFENREANVMPREVNPFGNNKKVLLEAISVGILGFWSL